MAAKLTSYQASLVSQLRVILADGAKNTHQIALARGDYQTYESALRDRLLRLAERGVLKFEATGKGRFWQFT